MLTDFSPLLITIFAFGAVATTVFVIGQFLAVQIRLQKRIAVPGRTRPASRLASSFDSLVSTYFDEKRFGVEGSVRTKLRRELVRAGFFRADAINYYIFARLAAAVIQQEFRIVFPDMLDLMVVCVDAGLSLEAALDRISGEITRQNRHLGINLALMGGEMRAGRSTIDALGSLADRISIDEARSLVAMLRQSIELGTDVGDALRVFSDEMRDRRLLRAEELANQLPVKMVGPLGLFIFPVILGLVLLPAAIRLFTALSGM